MARYAYVVAQAYGQSTYNNCTYNDSSCSTGTTTSTPSSGNSSPLANTGIAVLTIVTLACLIVFIALIVRMVGRRKQVPVAETIATDEDDTVGSSDVPPTSGSNS